MPHKFFQRVMHTDDVVSCDLCRQSGPGVCMELRRETVWICLPCCDLLSDGAAPIVDEWRCPFCGSGFEVEDRRCVDCGAVDGIAVRE